VIVTPLVSVVPALELAVSQDVVLIEYLTIPVEALTRYSIREGEKGPPWGPENVMLVEDVTINDGRDWPVGVWASPTCADNSVAAIASNTDEAIWLLAT
jgi:hypothetical protein